MKTILTVAGADSAAAAGVQADVKTIAAHGAYAVTAITAVTAQTRTAVTAIEPVSVPLLKAQLRATFEEFDIAAAKTGMLADAPRTHAVAEVFEKWRPPHYVLDPVLAASAGTPLLANDAVDVLRQRLLPLAELVTPNVAEAERLADMPVSSLADARRAAKVILGYGCQAVLVKGGHLASAPATDLLVTATDEHVFSGDWIASEANRGTGCAYSAAIAANLAKGASLECAVAAAKHYVAGALRAGPAVEGTGVGPMHHGYALRQSP